MQKHKIVSISIYSRKIVSGGCGPKEVDDLSYGEFCGLLGKGKGLWVKILATRSMFGLKRQNFGLKAKMGLKAGI